MILKCVFIIDIERLTSDKVDLLTRLQEDLKIANDCEKCVYEHFNTVKYFISVLTMKEKAISGMMAAEHRRDTDVEERISHLKKVIRSQLLSFYADVLTLCNGVDRSLRN